VVGQGAGVPASVPATILVVEGNAAVQELIEQALRDSGHYILSTQNSLEALELVRRIQVDILIAGDLLERRVSLVAELRDIQPELALVSICGPDDDVDDEGLGFKLSAPFSLSDLRAAITDSLELLA
jgi:CheY-like chemotaxis protein